VHVPGLAKFGGREERPRQPFSLADLRTVADALYGGRRWQPLLARDLGITPQAIKRWFAAKPLRDIRNLLADRCRRSAADNPSLEEQLARKLEKLGPPER
jgi:hypothetical protein